MTSGAESFPNDPEISLGRSGPRTIPTATTARTILKVSTNRQPRREGPVERIGVEADDEVAAPVRPDLLRPRDPILSGASFAMLLANSKDPNRCPRSNYSLARSDSVPTSRCERVLTISTRMTNNQWFNWPGDCLFREPNCATFVRSDPSWVKRLGKILTRCQERVMSELARPQMRLNFWVIVDSLPSSKCVGRQFSRNEVAG